MLFGGTGAEVIDGFSATFLSLKIIGPGAAPKKMTGAGYMSTEWVWRPN